MTTTALCENDFICVHSIHPGPERGQLMVTFNVRLGSRPAPLELLTRLVFADSTEADRFTTSRKLRVWVLLNPRCKSSESVLAPIVRHATHNVIDGLYVDDVEPGYHHLIIDTAALGVEGGDEVGVRGELFF